jgi:alpha-N-arabinofuranosidase
MAGIIVNARRSKGTVNRNIFGHFSEHLGRCIYQGLYVGEDSGIPNVDGMRKDVVQALKAIRIPVLRWPGGCFADEYHWQDGIGPKAMRKRMVNTNWGHVVEDNSFGTHEFLTLCRQLGCEPYVNGNVGSGTVREMAEWVEYLNSDGNSSVVEQRHINGQKEPFGVKYFGVGNESWGCGGNMRPEYYADEYRRYQTYCRDYGDNKLFRIACGPSDADYRWTDVLMQNAGRFMDAITMHYYTWTGPDWQHKGSATQFTASDYYNTLRKAVAIEPIIRRHLQVMDRHDPEHRVGLIVDEWGTWFTVEPGTNPGFLYQQNTMRDAMVAALTLNAFMAHCDRVVMANLAQTVNVLQAVVLTEGDRMVLTPTYHVFDLYKAHQDAAAADCFVTTDEADADLPQLHASASIKDGALTLTVANASADKPVNAALPRARFPPAS